MATPFSLMMPGWPGVIGSLQQDPQTETPPDPGDAPTMQFDDPLNSQLLAVLEDF